MLLMGCGIAGFFLVRNDYPLAPLVLGLVLGPMIENNMRRALTTSNGDFMIFLHKPMSAVFLLIAVLWIVVPLLLRMRGKQVIVSEEG
jgi:putative tricarboxylic transport membrane protein